MTEQQSKRSPSHTPGPWHIGVRDKFIYGPQGEEIADCDMITNFPDENLANTRLIAAAPDLFAALGDLQKELRAHVKLDVKKHYSLMTADAAATAAIEKASGL